MNADEIISRLDKVRSNGVDKWIACCPAHEDKSPSLSVRDTGDRMLLHCFGSCSIEDICAAIGIGVHDLFINGRTPREIIPGISRRDVLDTLEFERWLCEVAEQNRVAGKELNNTDLQREQLARQFIRAAAGLNHG